MMRDILNQEINVTCFGCAIAAGAATPPGGIICATEHFVLHQDPLIPIAGFLIVASKAHLRSIIDFDTEARREMVDLVYQGVAALKKLDVTQEVTIIQEERSSHFHVWLFPWHDWMDSAGFHHSVANTRAIIAYAQNKYQSPEAVANILKVVQNTRDYMR